VVTDCASLVRVLTTARTAPADLKDTDLFVAADVATRLRAWRTRFAIDSAASTSSSTSSAVIGAGG
jgi:hypothetical protein